MSRLYVQIIVLICSVIYTNTFDLLMQAEDELFFPPVVRDVHTSFLIFCGKYFLQKFPSSCQISRLSLISRASVCFAPSAAFFPVSRQCEGAQAPANAI